MNSKGLGVALVTRASAGIGKATAQALARAGNQVFGTSKRATATPPPGITRLVCDVTGDELEAVADAVVRTATDKTPKHRYTPGKTAGQFRFMRRFIPEKAFEKSFRKQMNLPA